MSTQSPEHNLIFNVLKEMFQVLDISQQAKNVLANECAIRLRTLVRVKERDE